LNDPFELSTSQPAPQSTQPAFDWRPLSCAAAILFLAIAVFVCVYLLFAMVGYGFLG
jgi:hypothetical protein